MEERKWEDLEIDCLVNVLGRVGMESLLLDIPFVCKSWHKASLSPLCWKLLRFPFAYDSWRYESFLEKFQDLYRINKLSSTKFIKFIVDRSCKNTTLLILPSCCTKKALKYVADECPSLEILGLPSDLCKKHSSIILELIGKWKNLKGLIIQGSLLLREILPQISLNCKDFAALRAFDNAYIGKEEASAIVTSLPNIKQLYLRSASIDEDNLVTILQGCKELDYLDVSDCIGFEVDDKILELASHITTFKHEGSRLYDDDPSDWVIELDEVVYDGYGSD